MKSDESDPGEGQSDAELLEAAYEELRRLAAAYLARERSDHTLQPTALVHEAYAKLAGQDATIEGRAHFVGIAAQAMRRVLVDHARGKGRSKRGGGAWQRIDLDQAVVPEGETNVDLVNLDEALRELADLSERQARVVELRFFGGMSVEEVASLLGTSERTVAREWRFARAWLGEELERMKERD